MNLLNAKDYLQLSKINNYLNNFNLFGVKESIKLNKLKFNLPEISFDKKTLILSISGILLGSTAIYLG